MSLQVLQDFVYELKNDPTVSAIVDERVFYRNPIEKQTEAYLVYTKNMNRSMVDEKYFFQIVAFSKTLEGLEELTAAIIALFEDSRHMGATQNQYYSIALLNVADGRQKLDTGFWFNTLSYEIGTSV